MGVLLYLPADIVQNLKNPEIFLEILLIAAGNVLALLFHNVWFANIAWIAYGIILIINPVYLEKYSSNIKNAKLGFRIAGIICILAGILTRYIV